MSSEKDSPSKRLSSDDIKAIRKSQRDAEMRARAEGRYNRSVRFKSKKDYDRKDESWREQ
jgi:hypothetical protein